MPEPTIEQATQWKAEAERRMNSLKRISKDSSLNPKVKERLEAAIKDAQHSIQVFNEMIRLIEKGEIVVSNRR